MRCDGVEIAHRHGSVLLWSLLIVTILIGMSAFAVDLGRLQAAKSELQSAADAAARYGVRGLNDNTATSKAIAAAMGNYVAGEQVTLLASDVTPGRYDAATRRFTPNASPANCLRVVARRDEHTRPIGSGFASFFGVDKFAIRATSYALLDGSGPQTGGIPGFVGIDWFNFNGNLSIRAWDSQTNSVPGNAYAVARTRGPINLNNGLYLDGQLRKTGSSVSTNHVTITRGIVDDNSPLNYPLPATPASATRMGNFNGPSTASKTFAAGKYYFDSFNVPTGKRVEFAGPVELYVNGSFNVAGELITHQNDPSNLRLFAVSGSGVDIGSNASPIYANIYAPQSPMNLNERTFYGSIVAKGINVNSRFNMYIDTRMNSSNAIGTEKVVTLALDAATTTQ